MEYKLNKLNNGLRILTVPIPSLESATVCVWVKTGSRFEEKKLNGISHFLEHMAFKGGKKYKNAKEVSEMVDGMGAVNNAGTSKEWTNFWIKTSVSNLEKAFDVLSDMVITPALLPEEIEKEREVIKQEIAMYEDTPMMSIGEEFEALIFKNMALGWKIAGDSKSLANIKKEEFVDYRRKHYHADNMLISVSGGAKQSDILKLSNKYFSALRGMSLREVKSGKNQETVCFADGQDRQVGSKERVLLKSKKSDQAHFILGYKTDGRNYKGAFAQEVLTTILGRGMSSRLFTQIRERRGLAYAVRAFREEYIGVGEFGIYAGVDVAKINEAIKVTLSELDKISAAKNIVSKQELDKAKNYIKGKIALSLEDSSEVGDFFAEQALLDDKIYTPEEYFSKVDKVNIDDVYYEAEKIFKKKSYLAVIGPYQDKAGFEKLIK